MKKRILLFVNFLLVSLILSLSAYAQVKNVLTGVVKTSDDKPAANITVGLKGTSIVTQTDESGKFVLKNVPIGAQLVKISGVGVKTQEISVTTTEGANKLGAVTISESASSLDEVNISTYKSSNKKASTIGKVAIPARDLPQAVQVITSQVIQDQQADRLGDVMKNVNGVALGSNRGGVGENFYARGYSLGSNNVFKNGARTSIGGSPEASTLESVEVLKGSAALLYGGVSGGAVVNMVTKKPKFENSGEVSFRTGSYDQYKGMVDVYGPVNQKLAFRIVATGEKAGSFRDHVSSDRIYVNPSLLYKFNENTDLLVQGDYLKSNYTPDFGVGTVAGKIVDFGRDKFLNTPWAYNKTNTSSAQANLNHRFNEQWKLNVIGAFQNYNRNYYGSERINPPATGIIARNLNRAKTNEYTYNQQVNLNGEVYTGKIKHTILVGADADQSNTTSNAFNYVNKSGALVSSFNYGNVNVFDPLTYEGDGYMPETRATVRTTTPVYRLGAFVQNLISFSDKFKVLAGVRWSYQKTPRTNTDTLLNNKVGRGTAATKIDKAFSPKFGLIYQPVATTSLYVSYANNFTTNSGIDIATNAPMAPSIIDQYEAGVKNDFLNGRLSVNATYYKIKNSNLAQAALTDATKMEFSGATESDGVEIDVTGSPLKGLNVIAGYAYNYMRFTNTHPSTGAYENVRMVNTTKNTANASVFYTFQQGSVKGLKVGASAYYVGDRNAGWNNTKNNPNDRVMPLKAYTTVDLTAGYAWKKFSLLAKLSNITNELNYSAHENYSINPIPPRQFVTTLSYKF